MTILTCNEYIIDDFRLTKDDYYDNDQEEEDTKKEEEKKKQKARQSKQMHKFLDW